MLLAAGDTFRAAAREQLIAWGERNNVAVVAQDSRAIGSSHLRRRQRRTRAASTSLLADTAGRLPTQLHLMEEI